MKYEQRIYTINDIPTIAAELKMLLERYPAMTFSGSLGTGKTTLVQELLRQSGITDRVTSPTFAYVNRYKSPDGVTFFHFDLYRINSLQDFCGAGFDEYLYAPHTVSLIEWPEHIVPLLKENVCEVQLDYHTDPAKRILQLRCYDKR